MNSIRPKLYLLYPVKIVLEHWFACLKYSNGKIRVWVNFFVSSAVCDGLEGRGFIYGLIQKWSIEKSIKMGNACGSHVVTKEGCANFMPTLEEALKIMNK